MKDDQDPIWQEIVAQVDEALSEAELTDKTTRDAVLAGVREAMSALCEPPRPAGKPHIEVLQGGWQPQEEALDPGPDAQVTTRVHREPLVRVRPGEGTLHLPEEGGVQTVLHAGAPRAYRLRCSSGRLRVMAEGQPIAMLISGQSIDVEASLIQVSSAAAARGRYQRLTPRPGSTSRGA